MYCFINLIKILLEDFVNWHHINLHIGINNRKRPYPQVNIQFIYDQESTEKQRFSFSVQVPWTYMILAVHKACLESGQMNASLLRRQSQHWVNMRYLLQSYCVSVTVISMQYKQVLDLDFRECKNPSTVALSRINV